jgi:hypothetical protein
LPSFFFALDYQRKSGPGSCMPVRYAAVSFASLSLSGQRKEVDFCLFAKIFCYSVDFEKEKGLYFPFFSQSPHGVHAPPYRKMQLHFFVFDMDI